MMQSFLSKGVAACQKGFERVTNEAKASLEEKKLLEDENCKLREENKRLKNQSRQLNDQVQSLTEQSTKQRTTINALKQELERSMQCYEECRTELKDMVTHYNVQEVQIQANANHIAELKRLKGELEDTLEKNEAYCHQWGNIWPRPIVASSSASVLKPKSLRLQITLGASSNS
jgi:chromosome segregation ATPase